MSRCCSFIVCLVACFFLPSIKGGWGGVAYAQKQGQYLIDSLIKELPKTKNDTNKVILLNSLSYNYQLVHANKGVDYGKQALQLAQKLKWDKGIAMAQNNIAGNYNGLWLYDTALIYAGAALAAGKKRNDNTIIANSLIHTGNSYYNGKADYAKALDYLQQAADYAGKTNDALLSAWIQFNTGSVYHRLSEYDKAKGYFDKAWQSGTRMNNHLLIAVSDVWMASHFVEQGVSDSAVKPFKRSLAACLRYGFREAAALCYSCLGIVAYNMSDYPATTGFLQQAISIYEETGNKFSMSDIKCRMGWVYSALSDYPRALECYQNALTFYKQSGFKLGRGYCISNIGECYERMGDYPQALKYYKESISINKGIRNKALYSWDLYNVGHIYYYLADYAQSLHYAREALKTDREQNSIGNRAYIFSLYAALWLHAPDSVLAEINIKPPEKYHYALTYADSSLQYANEGGSMEDMALAWQTLSEIHQKQGHYDKALEAYQNYITMQDSAIGNEVKKQVTRKEMQFEFDKKVLSDSLRHADEKRLADLRLQKQKSFTYTGLAGVGTLLLFSVFVFKSYTTQKKTNVLLSVEKQKSERLLLNILPHEVAEELKEKGYAEAQQFDKVTVLFTDFVNFTQASEQLSPQTLVQELHECFTTFDYIIGRHGLEKIKTVGDAYMAVCGLPLSDPRHAQKTVQAALEIRDFIEKRKEAEKVFDIRIGIHSGSVVAGIVGIKKFAYDIWGDTVNTAARMESSSEPGKVNISETTYELVKADFTCAYRGEIEAKNKGMMKMYFVN